MALFVVNSLGTYLPLVIRNAIDELEIAFDFSAIFPRHLINCWVSFLDVVYPHDLTDFVVLGLGVAFEFDLKQNIFEHLLSLETVLFFQPIQRATLLIGPLAM